MTQPADHGESRLRRNSIRRRDTTHLDVHQPSASVPSDNALGKAVRLAIGDQNFCHWFENRSRFEATGNQLIVHVANPFICSWIMKRFRQQLTTAAVDLLGQSAGFTVHVDGTLGGKTDAAKKTESKSPQTAPETTSATSKSNLQTRASVSAELQRTDDPTRLTTRQPVRRRFRSFQSFVPGPCNELSIMAARQISEAPGERFNPLYLHGSTGVGKSHLLESIYGEIRKTRPELNVLFLSSESFTNYFTSALANRSVPSFRQRFRNVDVLLVDNIEFLGNKNATQEEFLHTIDQVTDHGGQLVLTSDRHPRLLTKHREELTARFVGGLVCKIEKPAECTRRKLVESLALPHRDQLSNGALSYIASHGGRNARELQGSVNSLVCHAALQQGRITTAQARSLLGNLKEESRHLIRINDVERVVCEAFGVSAEDMRSKTRRKAISCPRSVAMYVARNLTRVAWREIGQYFGGRDHSTVVAAAKRVNGWVNENVTVHLPNSCRGNTWSEIVQEIEERLLAMAS